MANRTAYYLTSAAFMKDKETWCLFQTKERIITAKAAQMKGRQIRGLARTKCGIIFRPDVDLEVYYYIQARVYDFFRCLTCK